ncbi:putative integral membrane metal-binding protein [Encephalitozoon intestinalis ATCC 50506]|uniref:Endoplasmic reticulum junction formation protein lunapark n=1 Tax=Encephalitozoon intestinalis (strain ATCC 50506) TaxID=876142 RepID=E0S9D2_ENCIT|nr:putative integral membrane metal-binding protein [Encephalitozoon intestinalis ATCC 50506]ADM12196.2 putative integral membrane metal-binding protein [Encephalitozoon intestinalis ATCC 50506]UTX46003.1 putative integral membrane metal-binding protein [Encephalitozoon intestinalis]
MGNVLSRNVPLRESLVRLEEQISKKEKAAKDLSGALNSLRIKMFLASCVVIVLSMAYSYADDQNMVLFGVGSALGCYIVRCVLIYLYEIRIQRLESSVEALKEIQKEQIALLKKEESFEATKKVIDKYESESMRRHYFGSIKQRRRGMMDSVTDIVLGDDPSTMYALICKRCNHHNGLVHPSEYDLNEFYCYNCNELNARSKNRNSNK